MKAKLADAFHETFRSVRIRNFRLFFSGLIVSQVGNWITMVALVLLVLDRTDSGLAIGLMTACQYGPILVLGPWTGLVADRSDKRRLLFVVQSCAMAQSGVLAVLAFAHHAPIGLFYAVALLGGFATAFDNPARRSLVVELVPEDHLANAVSLNSATMMASRVVGPAVAGLLIATVGYGWCFAVDGVSYIAVLVGLWLIDPTQVHSPEAAQRGKGQVRAGLRYIRRIPVLWVSLVMTAVIGALSYNFTVVLPLFVRRTFHGSGSDFTVMFALISVGAVVSALWIARRRTTTFHDVLVAEVAFGLSMLALAAAPNLGTAYAISVLVGLTSIAYMTGSTALVQLRADPSMRGRVVAVQAMVFLGSTPIGGPLVGQLCEWWGPRSGLLVGAVAALVTAAWGSVAGRHMADEETAIPPGVVVASPPADLQVA